MKIAIFTIVDWNFGNRLQNYALQCYLEDNFNTQVKTIKRKGYFYEKLCLKNFYKLLSYKEIIKFILNYNEFRSNILKKIKIQNAWIDFDKNIHYTQKMTNKLDVAINKSFDKEFDYFIVGSDQVWNPDWHPNIDYFKYMSKDKCIAYAASFGRSSVPEHLKKDFSTALDHINYISVRESAGAGIVKDLINREIPVVIDPTLLLSKNEWLTVAKKPNWYSGKKYILAFFLGDISKERKKIIKKLAIDNECEIIYPLKDINDDWAKIGPAEFLYLVNNSEFVLTDSFHGTVFSIIMNKPFFVFDRDEKNLCNMNSRLDTLLNLFDFEDRHIRLENSSDYKKQIYDIDFSNVHQILNREREKSYSYLRKAMSI